MGSILIVFFLVICFIGYLWRSERSRRIDAEERFTVLQELSRLLAKHGTRMEAERDKLRKDWKERFEVYQRLM